MPTIMGILLPFYTMLFQTENLHPLAFLETEEEDVVRRMSHN